MADRTIKPDSGNDLVLQNNGGGTKIEIPNSGDIEITGTIGSGTFNGTIGDSATFPAGTVLQVKNKYVTDTHTSNSSDFVWDDTYLDVTAKADNSKYLVIFSGNGTPDGGTNEGDSIEGFGFAVDPAGGTSWTYFGGGTNTTHTTNTKFFLTRFDQSGSSLNRDVYYHNLFSGIGEYTSSVNAGTTLRFAIRYFHYYHATLHPNITINSSFATGSESYHGNLATSYSVFEIKT